MTDPPAVLAILVPSRGRPAGVARLIKACEETCKTNAYLLFGFDDDDPCLEANQSLTWLAPNASSFTEPRMGLAEWTNFLAELAMKLPISPTWLASIGDDMVPVTDGWDTELIATIERDHAGTGFAYPNDGIRDDIPEAVIVSTSIVRALGWMANPACHHFYIDDTWRDLGRGAGCLTYRPDVIVEHRHSITGAPMDQTYADASPHIPTDGAAYRRWRLYQMPADVAKIKALRS